MSEAGSVATRRICLVGATGLVGSAVIARAVGMPGIRLVGVARREVPLPPGARMEMLIADPSGWDDAIAASGADVLVCALGTTWRKAGRSQAAFRAVDHDLVLECARSAKKAGIEHMIHVSSTSADMASRHFYMRTKGETENALGKIGFRRLDILRPGLLRGRRQGDPRPLESLANALAPVIDLLLQGKYRRYRSIPADRVAQAILALARQKPGGRFVHEHDAILYAIRRSGA